MNKIAVFYHIGQINHWKEIYEEQMKALHDSGLYSACDFVFCAINGTEPLPGPIPEKVLFDYNQDHVLEANTLERLWRFCKDYPDHRVLYMHTKGVTWINEHKETTARWRRYMEHFNVFKWKQCLKELETHDTCGVLLKTSATYLSERPDEIEMPALYYDGNFWWANAKYINTLDPQFLYTHDTPWLRGKSELWIGSGNPKAACLHNLEYINPYYHGDFSRELYMTNERKSKIVMIAMFKNEAPVLRRMLDSTLGYCDYYVMQNNGSTDGSDEIAKNFLIENKLSGEVYNVEEGWVGFGWNRDHLIKHCQKINHGCDWILKMDCDEVLEIDEDFDWALIDDKTIHGFHICAVSGSTIYHRAWMWNASLPWAFHHDPCHETIYCQIPEIGTEFHRIDLPQSFRQVGFNEGQSWGVATKFVSDSLILEEKMIREQDMLENLYHFWYIGKSYADAWPCSAFPLGEIHQKEYARRCVFYFNEYVRHTHPNGPSKIDELAYVGLILSAEAQTFLKDYTAAINTYKFADAFAPGRNDHLIGMANIYKTQSDYINMLGCTTIMMQESRKCPFPQYGTFIDREMYIDTGSMVQRLHEEATHGCKVTIKNEDVPLAVNKKTEQNKRIFIVDNFYVDPDKVREFALSVPYDQDLRWYKGQRTLEAYRTEEIKKAFEHIIGERIVDWNSGYNGVFQLMQSSDPQVYHYDTQKWAAMIYLSPDAPLESGTRLHKSKRNGTRHRDDFEADLAFAGDFYDSTKFDISDAAANIYNRLVIMDAGSFHSAGPYFGNDMQSGRLTHLFFFD
jgi:glycosyltransferase involved in cell wall biosynthesis